MEQLGTMDPEQLLRLLLGVISCALVMMAVTVVYIVLARRMRRGRSDRARQSDEYIGATALRDGQNGMAVPDVTTRLTDVSRAAGQAAEARMGQIRPAQCASEILRVVQDISSGRVAIKIAGTRYTRLGEVRDQTLGKRILAAITWALRFSGGRVAEDEGVTSLNLPPCDGVHVPESAPLLVDEDEPGEIMRLLGDAKRGEFWVQVAGRCYARLDDVTDPDVSLRILGGISYLLQFSYGRLMANDGIRSVPVPKLTAKLAASVVHVVASEEGQPRAMRDQEEQFFQSLMRTSESSQRWARRISAAKSYSSTPKARSVPASLVEEVDRIFQRKLEASPYAHLDAQFVERPDGSVRIRVGTKFYESPDEVPDPGLREIIKAAIAEW
ncbi:MAG: hypothetical protein DDG58_12140 [Ardenticatenia bacterium]|jgi:membrane protein implicated in regulation of membrane protease activity|nr:MAG: hypothetical protein DDG58_12140 [Ardenticatenia bacterium]